MLADAEDRHDVRVVELGDRLRLALEPPEPLRVEVDVVDHLDGDVAAERLLHRLVDDAHPAAAQLAEDAELAEPLGHGRPAPAASPRRSCSIMRDGAEQLADPARRGRGSGPRTRRSRGTRPAGTARRTPRPAGRTGRDGRRRRSRSGRRNRPWSLGSFMASPPLKSGEAFQGVLEPLQGADVALARGGGLDAQQGGDFVVARAPRSGGGPAPRGRSGRAGRAPRGAGPGPRPAGRPGSARSGRR